MDEHVDLAIVGPDEAKAPLGVVDNHLTAQHVFPSCNRGKAALISSLAR
jgi:hypothetical protein